MTSREFRESIKTQLDRVVAGEVVTIERGGITFQVIVTKPKGLATTLKHIEGME